MPIFLVIGLMIFIGRRFNPKVDALSVLLIYVFVPALTFTSIANSALDGDVLLAIGIVVFGVMVGMVILTQLALKLGVFGQVTPQREGGIILTTLLMNAANYGIPLNTFAFGAEGGAIAVIYYVVSSLIGNILGVYYASRGQVSIKKAIKNVVSVPIAYAAILGFLVNATDTTLPLALSRSLDIVASGAIPVMLALLGLSLAKTQLSGSWYAIGVASGFKLVLAPLIALPLGLAVGLSGVPLSVVIVESGTPTAVIASAIAAQFGSDTQFVAATTLVNTLLSIFTISALLLMLGANIV